jgi:hypothetical protein
MLGQDAALGDGVAIAAFLVSRPGRSVLLRSWSRAYGDAVGLGVE